MDAGLITGLNQLSEVKFHEGLKYIGKLRPKDDAGRDMVWPLPPATLKHRRAGRP